VHRTFDDGSVDCVDHSVTFKSRQQRLQSSFVALSASHSTTNDCEFHGKRQLSDCCIARNMFQGQISDTQPRGTLLGW